MPIPLRLIKVEQSDASTVTQQTDIEKVDDKLEWLKMFSLIPVKQSVSGSATSNNGEGTRKRLADPACEASVIASDTIIKPKRSIVSTGKGGVSLAFEAKKDRLGTFGCTIHTYINFLRFSPKRNILIALTFALFSLNSVSTSTPLGRIESTQPNIQLKAQVGKAEFGSDRRAPYIFAKKMPLTALSIKSSENKENVF